jgi:phenylacetate-CoA ligase
LIEHERQAAIAMRHQKRSLDRQAGWDYETELRAYARVLTMTEWLRPDELRSYQAPLVAKLLLHARKTTKFYKDRLAFDFRSAENVQKIWTDIPIVTRAEAVANRLKLMSNKTPPGSGPVREGRTSGSTGIPFAYKRSGAASIANRALTERMFRWWAVDGRRSFAQIAYDRKNTAPPPDGLTSCGWHPNHPDGLKHFISVQADTDTHLNWLIARRPDYLAAYPPVLKELASTALKRGVELEFAQVMSFGAVLDPETRELCRAAFGSEIADTYGAQEVDHMAAQCRDCGEYHISAEAVLLEVLRADGSAAAPGEIGRVVVTPLYNFAMPLIRYEIGDMAEAGSASPACGRSLPTLRRILGRTRNMFRFRDGTVLWPIPSTFATRKFIAFKQAQIVQTDLDHIEIRYVPEDTARQADLPALTEHVRSVLRQPVDVVVRSVDRIERSTSGKYEECVSLVPADLQDHGRDEARLQSGK